MRAVGFECEACTADVSVRFREGVEALSNQTKISTQRMAERPKLIDINSIGTFGMGKSLNIID
jgi:hypothetical protein